jgi:hypothetical protein
MELDGRTYPRYLVWHPIDHIHFEVVRRLPDGTVGSRGVFHIVEALGADMTNLVDARLHLERLDERGAAVEVRALAQTVLEIRGQFLRHSAGTRVISTMTIGSSSWLGDMGLNPWLVDRLFPAERRQAWLKHNVEEIGHLQFFLPDLLELQQQLAASGFRYSNGPNTVRDKGRRIDRRDRGGPRVRLASRSPTPAHRVCPGAEPRRPCHRGRDPLCEEL